MVAGSTGRWLALVALFMLAGLAQAQGVADRPVRLLVGYPAGGPLDTVARSLAPALSGALGQPVVVENRPGASGVLACEAVVRAPADGNALILQGVTHALLPALRHDLPFDTARDFTAVALVGRGALIAVVPASSPAKSLAEFVALAKAQPAAISYASAGSGTSLHVAVEMLKRAAGIEMTHVPYKGSAPAHADLVAGRVQFMMDVAPSALPLVKGGKLRALAVTGPHRLPDLPEVPTVAEAGYPSADFVTWWGAFGPARIAPERLSVLNAAFVRAVATVEFRERLQALGAEAASSSAAEFDRLVRDDLARFATIVREAGIVTQ